MLSQVVALKPAPVQVTWLGWDASGIPAIDYFIADPYVLPESDQDTITQRKSGVYLKLILLLMVLKLGYQLYDEMI